MNFRFSVISKPQSLPDSGKNHAYLLEDRWDDWGKFRTQFHLFVFDQGGERHDLGEVKIAQFGLKGAPSAAAGRKRAPDVPQQFTVLSDDFFSLGQSEAYYEALGRFTPDVREAIAKGLRDVVADKKLWKEVLNEEAMTESLLRFVRQKNVEDQFRRLLNGGARLSAYSFSYAHPKRTGGGEPPLELKFNVEPSSSPPTNVHVLIGRNGVGKTYTLNLMIKALVGDPAAARQSGRFRSSVEGDDTLPFANLVSVSFSAFDDFEVPQERTMGNKEGLPYSYIGLRRSDDASSPKSPQMLGKEFGRSVRTCVRGARAFRWKRALTTLEADPLFKEAELTAVLTSFEDGSAAFDDEVAKLFKRLSSGHKIVLLTIARLVETVDEKTLVLLDEPEAHLHPPLLAAFVRALSDLLVDRNGVAIIATHSPVILQEVPKECVWKLRRTGLNSVAERPEVETFGENVGVLTREVFGLEVTQSGFHKLLQLAADEHRSFDSASSSFDDKLGAEARAILRGLLGAKQSSRE